MSEKRKVPRAKIKDRDYVIICEGEEERDYLNRLKELRVWDENTDVCVKCAGSLDNVEKIFLAELKRQEFRHVVALCDTEEYPYAQFKKLRDDMTSDLGASALNCLFFVNPNSMQIILLHFTFVRIASAQKSKNGRVIEKHIGVKLDGYRATESQRKRIMARIDEKNYRTMRENLKKLGDDFMKPSSTNIGKLFDALEGRLRESVR